MDEIQKIGRNHLNQGQVISVNFSSVNYKVLYRANKIEVYAFGGLWNKKYVTDIQNLYVNQSVNDIRLELDEKILFDKII